MVVETEQTASPKTVAVLEPAFSFFLYYRWCFTDQQRHFTYKEIVIGNPVPFDQTKVTQKPNVYFLLFDEYAGYKSLQDSFNFKNDSFYNYL